MDFHMDNLISQIEEKRHSMINLAHQHGYTSSYVVQCSQELDALLNEYRLLRDGTGLH
ncbi:MULTISPECIES: aspartyl-phosphate phosphatase Spo0E family protein [unclassified Bacillus (in: firmicutes)]|uniref:aspartyl-phosphate phosphatase Spo0E family protein n=1 Tax=unclassified Bacillus (in: firmicutes) TaxID=185979 RepID=UPI0008EABBB2|nr:MULTISPECIES: aspartyl-phosphate phosphatase Spo0E family protein [unclassified Bacillus (in: firmicutes)]SFB13215.1 Spo0E like sporulation regulatory protein [Bacillus sp. UNCCL13]SFQ90073.1 Spo0E like sporulation regulatory protein [Bacillus sp. cl95]